MELEEALAKIARLEEELAYEREQSSKLIKQQVDKVREGYSADRLSLALEIKETLETRGHWAPKENWAGPDLITAVGKALDKDTKKNSEDHDVADLSKGTVRGYFITDIPLTRQAYIDVVGICENVGPASLSGDADDWVQDGNNYLVDDGEDIKFMYSWLNPQDYKCQVITYTDFMVRHGNSERPKVTSGTAKPMYCVKG